jgi:NTE family protein
MEGSKLNGRWPRVGLVLGGGGVRGLAHIGVLTALEEAGVPIDLIAGTSMGGLIGALYAAGLTPAEIEAQVLEQTEFAALRRLLDIRLSFEGLLRGERIFDLINDLIGPNITFADLTIPLKMVSVDVLSGREVTLGEGLVAEAVRATISVPAVFVPVERNNMVLVDGGILNNVPTNVAQEMGAELIIAVDVMPDYSGNVPGEEPLVLPLDPPLMPEFMQELFNVEYIMISALTAFRLAQTPPHLLVRPTLPQSVDLLIGFERAEEVIEAGLVATREALARFEAEHAS